jgi:hypothetical protein
VKANPLYDQLRSAFPPTPIVATDAFKQRGMFYCDAAEYRAQMDGKTWEELDPQFFSRRSDGLDFLGTTQLVQVLPLYLHLMLVFKPTSPVPETLLPALTKPEPGDWPAHIFEDAVKRFDELVAVLSEAQKRVITATLRQFTISAPGEAPRAQPALDRYWNQFLTQPPQEPADTPAS